MTNTAITIGSITTPNWSERSVSTGRNRIGSTADNATFVHRSRWLMLANIIWGVGALIIGGYMVVALLRPEKF